MKAVGAAHGGGDGAPGTPEGILPTYERVGATYAADRLKSLFERPALDRFLEAMPGPSVLDLGCGSGDPIARYLAAQSCRVTGVDGAATMVGLFLQNLPGHTVHRHDMRTLALGQRFDGIIAWDSVFHLTPQDQAAMFPVFAAHATDRAALTFTSGPSASTSVGTVGGEPVYHASLDPEHYTALLNANGFAVRDVRLDDPECDRHSVWLAVKTAGPG